MILCFRKDSLGNGRIFLNKSYKIQNVGLCYTTVECDIGHLEYFDLCCECGCDSYLWSEPSKCRYGDVLILCICSRM